MSPKRSAYGMIRGHDLGDVMDKIIDKQMERLAWLEPKKSTRSGSVSKKPLPSDQ
jgi:hypothetical protein